MAGLAVALVALLLADRLLGLLPVSSPSGRWQTPLPVVILGVTSGLTIGMSAVGLVLIYRTSRVINFAHGEMGALGAAVMGLAAVQWGVPYWLALPVALAASAAVGGAAELGVVRRLRNAPRVMSIVATLGVGQAVVALAFVLNGRVGAGAVFPQPPGLPVFHVGSLLVTPAYSGMLLITPLVVAALALFLKRSRFGLALRAAALNPEAARLSGIHASRTSSLAWAVAGSLSALSAILNQPTQGFSTAASFGPGLLLRGLACAAIARMTSIPIALGAGVCLGVIQQLLLWNFADGGLVQLALFIVIIVALSVQRRLSWREEEKGSWTSVLAFRPLPEEVRSLPAVRWGRRFGITALVVSGALVPAFVGNYTATRITAIIAFAIVGLSVGIATGLGGQLTLGPFAVASTGAIASYVVVTHTGSVLIGTCYACLASGTVSVLLGLPALRIRGLMLTVTTLAFALMTPAWLLSQSWAFGRGVSPQPPVLFGQVLDTGRSYYVFAYAGLCLAVLASWNIRRGGLGRLFVALRDNEANARAFGIPATATKLWLYLLSGMIAGIGGVVYTQGLTRITVDAFPAGINISILIMTVIGGLSLISGPILGAAVVVGIPTFVDLGVFGSLFLNFGLLLFILQQPRGVGAQLEPLRDLLVRRLQSRQRRGFSPTAEGPDTPGSALDLLTPRRGPQHLLRTDTPLLTVRGLTKSFGGVRAVQGLSIDVVAGQTLGLIGPNGAGKTTSFELISGFVRPDSGSVSFAGRDITGLGPEKRARLGLIRSFQDAALFPTMTVLDVVILAQERLSPSSVVGAALGYQASDRGKRQWAREITAHLGLERYQDNRIQELSTGTRRIAELACLVALQPTVLLLDEPSAGIAQRDTEALGELLAGLKDKLDITMLIIEHDIPLIMGLADRIIAMADGQVIADGTPEHVRNHPEVLQSYLGTGVEAIERSDRPSSTAGANGHRPHIPGLTTPQLTGLLQRFGTIDALRTASIEDLLAVPGVGRRSAQRVQHALSEKPDSRSQGEGQGRRS